QKHQRAIHLLSALDHQTRYVLSQTQVNSKTNKAKAALSFLKDLILQGKVVVGDAMFYQRFVLGILLYLLRRVGRWNFLDARREVLR
ncbi:MAG: hypothetical protein QM501_12530, partial [Gimesia sp.]